MTLRHSRKAIGKPVATSTKQITRYITTSGIQSEISYQEKNWPEATIKELMTNAWDALNDFYPTLSFSKEYRWITVIINIDRIPKNESTRLLRITVRNSNVDTDVKVFEDLNLIFDFDNWQSTKRNQHRGTGGALGDFLKRVLGMGYASWTESGDNYYNFDSDPDSDNFVDKQWREPLILRFNGQEYKIFIKVDMNISIEADIVGPANSNAVDYTEVCATLPVSVPRCEGADYGEAPLVDNLREYYNSFKFGKSNRTQFKFIMED
jgi:hypothetical protein